MVTCSLTSVSRYRELKSIEKLGQDKTSSFAFPLVQGKRQESCFLTAVAFGSQGQILGRVPEKIPWAKSEEQSPLPKYLEVRGRSLTLGHLAGRHQVLVASRSQKSAAQLLSAIETCQCGLLYVFTNIS